MFAQQVPATVSTPVRALAVLDGGDEVARNRRWSTG
jgi:hypothetical protein